LSEKKIVHALYKWYNKFSLKVQFAQVIEYPELIISFDGIARVLKKPMLEIEDTFLIQWTLFKNQVLNYQSLDSVNNLYFYNSMDFNSAFPILRDTLAMGSIINEPKEVLRNNYKKYNDRISEFAKNKLFTTLFKKVLKLSTNKFLKVPMNLYIT
jgi:hypothetical protein